jgi:hypothetical protein
MYLVNNDHNGMAVLRTKSDCEVLKKCCVSSALDGRDDHMLWNDSEEDGDVRSECEEAEGTDCEGGDSNTDW